MRRSSGSVSHGERGASAIDECEHVFARFNRMDEMSVAAVRSIARIYTYSMVSLLGKF